MKLDEWVRSAVVVGPADEPMLQRAEKLRALAGAIDALSVARRQSVANDGTVIIGLVLGSALSTGCYNHHAYVSNIALCAALEAEVARCEAALKEDGDA